MKRRTALLASGLTALALAPLPPLAPAWAATPSPPPDTTAPTEPAEPTTSPTGNGTATPTGSPTGSPTDGAAAAPFGPGCADLPQSGEGSIESMSKLPIGDAIAQNPELSTLSSALSTAKLQDQLNQLQEVTIFAPTDEAFNSLSQEELTNLLQNPTELQNVLGNHVVEKRVTKNDLTQGPLQTKAGEQLTVEGSGEDFTVNGEAQILCGDISTQNGTLYLIDQVLMPQ